jgi:hypothetical protein
LPEGAAQRDEVSNARSVDLRLKITAPELKLLFWIVLALAAPTLFLKLRGEPPEQGSGSTIEKPAMTYLR